MEQNNSMHAQAKKNTEDALSYLVVQAHAKSLELNQLGETLMKHAQMELYIAQMENVEFEALSSTAQKLHENPDLRIENRFVGQVYYLDKSSKTNINDNNVNEGNIYVVSPDKEEETKPSSSIATNSNNDKVITFVESKEDEISTPADDSNSEETKTEDEDVVEPETFVKVKPVAKSFDRLKPAYTGDIAKKIYKTSVMKPARELIKAMIDEQTQITLKNLVDVAAKDKKHAVSLYHSGTKSTLENYSVIASMYDAVIRGMDVADMEIYSLKDEASKIAELDSLACTIISNAEEFRQENVEALDNSKNLTAGNVKQYYTALGKFESTAENKISGQDVIKNEFANDVANIMSR